MKRLIAKRPILYYGRQYESGEMLPAHDSMMVDAWLRSGSAELIGSDPEPVMSEEIAATEETGEELDRSADDATAITAHLDHDALAKLSKENLEKLAAEIGVQLPRGASKALIVQKLAAVPVQAPSEAVQ